MRPEESPCCTRGGITPLSEQARPRVGCISRALSLRHASWATGQHLTHTISNAELRDQGDDDHYRECHRATCPVRNCANQPEARVLEIAILAALPVRSGCLASLTSLMPRRFITRAASRR
eukprot:1657352-Prymnesium_polylepis.1